MILDFLTVVTLTLLADDFIVIGPNRTKILDVLNGTRSNTLLRKLRFGPPLVSAISVCSIAIRGFRIPTRDSAGSLRSLSNQFTVGFQLSPARIIGVHHARNALRGVISGVITPRARRSFGVTTTHHAMRRTVARQSRLGRSFSSTLAVHLSGCNVLILSADIMSLAFSARFTGTIRSGRVTRRQTHHTICVTRRTRRRTRTRVGQTGKQTRTRHLVTRALGTRKKRLILRGRTVRT